MALRLTASRLVFAAAFIILTSAFFRLLSILPRYSRRTAQAKNQRTTPAHLLIVLGSGGHTAELLSILRNIDPYRYSPRTYVVSSGDALGVSKANEFERSLRERHGAASDKKKSNHELREWEYEIVIVPRARRIHQPLYTATWSSLLSLGACVQLLARIGLVASTASMLGPAADIVTSPDVILTNGPATGVIVILASLVVKFFGWQKGKGGMKTVYVESWARVRTLSLSGKILHSCGLVDRFLVQWKGLEGPGAEYRGPLVE